MNPLVRLALFAFALLLSACAADRPVSDLRARWAQPPSQFIALDGMQVHLRDEGPRDDPAPILLLHGTSASLHTWEGWAAALRGSRRVVRMDLPGFALTGPSPEGDYSIGAYVRFVRDFADRLGLRRFVIAGNSLGGEIAWNVAAAMPERVQALILVDAAGYPMELVASKQDVPLGFRIARTPWLAPLMEHVLTRGLVEASVRNVYGDPSKVTPGLVDLYYDMTVREGNRRALGQRMRQRTDGDVSQLAKIKVPTLILWGGHDRLTPPDFAHWFARDIAGSKLVIFDDLGHVPHEEDPARTVAEVAKFP